MFQDTATLPTVDGAVLLPPALWVHRGTPPDMPTFHRHDDLEINLVLEGSLTYLFGAERVVLERGQLALFWAATPHRLIEVDRRQASDISWVHLPLAEVMSWGLPADTLKEILTSRMIVVAAAAIGAEPSSTLDSWRRDISTGAELDSAHLEAHALVRRVLVHHRAGGHRAGADPESSDASSGRMQRVVVMAQFAAGNFREGITASDVAAAVHLNPRYATTLFRATLGVTLGEYLTRCRVAEAQRLLLTTGMTTSEIAHVAGFGSQSSLYASFERVCGQAPGSYRRRLRGEPSPVPPRRHLPSSGDAGSPGSPADPAPAPAPPPPGRPARTPGGGGLALAG